MSLALNQYFVVFLRPLSKNHYKVQLHRAQVSVSPKMSYLSTQVAPKSETTSTLTLSIRALSGGKEHGDEDSLGNSPGKKRKKAFEQRSKSARSARLAEADYERRKRKYIKWALAVINVVLIVIIGILAHCEYYRICGAILQVSKCFFKSFSNMNSSPQIQLISLGLPCL